MTVEILPGFSSRKQVIAPIDLPPDKSIFHRLLIIGSLSKSKIKIPISAIEEISVDVYATILALQSIGVPIEINRSEIIIQGLGLNGFHEPKHQINCANSGTTARLLMGLLAAQDFSSTLIGDDSLSKRPMKRLAEILHNELGAEISTSKVGTMPICIQGRNLHPGNIKLSASSAQMKSSLLIAGLCSLSEVSVSEPYQSRNHTEQMLNAFGIGSEIELNKVTILPDYHYSIPEELNYRIPGDISSAAFLIGAAILSKKNLILHKVGLNPTRTKFLDILQKSGLEMEVSLIKNGWNEEYGTIEIFSADTTPKEPFDIKMEDISLLIDEIPILAILAVFCNGITAIDNAVELRKKETDRISALAVNLTKFGVIAMETEDGLRIYGDEHFTPSGGEIEHFGDHRIAMALSVLAFKSKEIVTISDASVVSVSYPNFFKDLSAIVGSERIRIS